jgi:hypothetical protein
MQIISYCQKTENQVSSNRLIRTKKENIDNLTENESSRVPGHI